VTQRDGYPTLLVAAEPDASKRIRPIVGMSRHYSPAYR
jgi:hypothetical protein